jgi:hypothetical protein
MDEEFEDVKGLSEALFQGTDNTNACSDCLFFN